MIRRPARGALGALALSALAALTACRGSGGSPAAARQTGEVSVLFRFDLVSSNCSAFGQPTRESRRPASVPSYLLRFSRTPIEILCPFRAVEE
jgi:hypothetical protein